MIKIGFKIKTILKNVNNVWLIQFNKDLMQNDAFEFYVNMLSIDNIYKSANMRVSHLEYCLEEIQRKTSADLHFRRADNN